MKSYLITDPAYYGNDGLSLALALTDVFSHIVPDFILFRDKSTAIYPNLAHTFIAVCRKNNVAKVLLHGDPFMAQKLGADGVHLTSHQFAEIHHAKSFGLYVIVSTHTHMEALMAVDMGADAITYSPVFTSPNKGEPKGLEDLKEIVDKIRIPIFALGGIVSQEQISAVEATGAYGFASIRYFV